MIRFSWLAVGCLTALMCGAAISSADAQSTVSVTNIWARATPPSAATGAMYMTLTSPTGDTLTGVTTPAASTASVHEMSMTDNIMRMRPVDGGLKLPAGQAVTLKPGGYHIMLEGLKGPLKQGTDVPLHLIFQTASPLDVVAHVGSIGASGPQASGSMPGMTMGK